MKSWLNQHSQALSQVTRRMKAHALTTFLMFMLMGVTLCLPGTLYVIVDNLNRLADGMQNDPQISLFLKPGIDSRTVSDIAGKLEAHPDILSQRFISKDEAWENLQQNADTAAIAGNLEKNPLPDAYFVIPAPLTPEQIERLQTELQQWEGVELAQLDADWIKRLNAMLQLGKKAI